MTQCLMTKKEYNNLTKMPEGNMTFKMRWFFFFFFGWNKV